MGFFNRFRAKPQAARAPVAGEVTAQQGIAQAGVGVGQIPGFAQPMPGTYAVYRRMSAHPTLGLAKSIVTAPILAASWSFEVRRPDGKKAGRIVVNDGVRYGSDGPELAERAKFMQDQLEPLRASVSGRGAAGAGVWVAAV